MTVSVVCRILHIAATCTSLGGLFYARMVLWPLIPTLPECERETFMRRAIARYARIKWIGVTVIVVSGVIQWFIVWPTVTQPSLYITYFAIKMVAAFGLFSITFLLALPDERLRGMQRQRGFWSLLNILCGLTILIGAALMRSVTHG